MVNAVPPVVLKLNVSWLELFENVVLAVAPAKLVRVGCAHDGVPLFGSDKNSVIPPVLFGTRAGFTKPIPLGVPPAMRSPGIVIGFSTREVPLVQSPVGRDVLKQGIPGIVGLINQ